MGEGYGTVGADDPGSPPKIPPHQSPDGASFSTLKGAKPKERKAKALSVQERALGLIDQLTLPFGSQVSVRWT